MLGRSITMINGEQSAGGALFNNFSCLLNRGVEPLAADRTSALHHRQEPPGLFCLFLPRFPSRLRALSLSESLLASQESAPRPIRMNRTSSSTAPSSPQFHLQAAKPAPVSKHWPAVAGRPGPPAIGLGDLTSNKASQSSNHIDSSQ